MIVFRITGVLLLTAVYTKSENPSSEMDHSPNIYNFIANNAYICSPLQLSDGSSVVFLNEEAGKNCTECEHAPLGYGTACGIRKTKHEKDIISCFEVPSLCIDAFELRYIAHVTPKIGGMTSNSHRNLSIRLDGSENSNKKRDSAVKAFLAGTPRLKRTHNNKFMFIGTTTTTSSPKTTSRPCEDKHGLCCFWATTGECDKNPFWMRVHCAKTCGTCQCSLGNADRCNSSGIRCTLPTTTAATTTASTTKKITTVTATTLMLSSSRKKKYTRPYTPPLSGFRRTQTPTIKEAEKILLTTTPSTTTIKTTTVERSTTPDMKCRDYHEQCSFWAILGECRSNPFYMRPQCQKACNSCGENVDSVYAPTPRSGCDNGHRLCNYWAHIGECSSNANYMLPNCRLACRVC